jgi:hypothetical protein
MTDCVLPFPVESVEAADLDPSPVEMMLAAGGVGLENAAHAAICYPDLWPNADAARQAMHRAKRSVQQMFCVVVRSIRWRIRNRYSGHDCVIDFKSRF